MAVGAAGLQGRGNQVRGLNKVNSPKEEVEQLPCEIQNRDEGSITCAG